MIAGIKIGLRNWREILSDFHPQACEVWFRIDWAKEYQEMFSFLNREKIAAGLHFWGILPGSIMPNFAFDDREILKASATLVKKTVDIASKQGFRYVNIHPGSYQLTTIDFEREEMRPLKKRMTDPSRGNAVLFEAVSELHDYARNQGVLLLVETVPSREPMNWTDLVGGRLQTQDVGNVPVSEVLRLADRGFFISNDFCHTAMDVISEDRDYLFAELLSKTRSLAGQTRLLHVNTMLPPFNGTDCHLGILPQDFEEGVFPSREQLKRLLSLFRDRDDVWGIPEPFSQQVENTETLVKLIEDIQDQ